VSCLVRRAGSQVPFSDAGSVMQNLTYGFECIIIISSGILFKNIVIIFFFLL
jgi:hypothetical protein